MTSTPKRNQIEPNDSVSLELLGNVVFEPRRGGVNHAHPFWELLRVNGTVTLGNGDGSIALESGALCLIPPNRRHAFTNGGRGPLTLTYIGFSFALDPTPALPENLPIVVSNILQHTQIPIELQHLAEALEDADGTVNLKLRSQALRIVLQLLDVLVADAPNAPGESRHKRLVEKAKAHLRHSMDRTITVEEVAEMFYLSPHYFGELFKAETGLSLKAYHRELRLRHAAHLLATTDHTATQIAEDLGFDSLHTFSKLFKAHHGQSPRAFRKTLNLSRRLPKA